MKITVFTSNQPRHLAYIRRLSEIASEVIAVMEINTVFPGKVKDFFDNSPTMQEYFSRVRAAEVAIFGGLDFTPTNVRVMALKAGDVNSLKREDLLPALDSDYYLVFGSSFIKGWLVHELVDKQAINIHMGLTPYYRGSSCNFWAIYDERPAFVGATIHLLSEGLDNGPGLFHVRPDFRGQNLFEFTMESVVAAQDRVVSEITSSTLLSRAGHTFSHSSQIRYSRNRDFTDSVANEFLMRTYSPEYFDGLLRSKEQPELLR